MVRSTQQLRAAAVLLVASGFTSVAFAAPAGSSISSPVFSGDHLYRTSINIGAEPAVSSSTSSFIAENALPEAPDTLLAYSPEPTAAAFAAQNQPAHVAPKYEVDIPAGWQAQPLSARDKFIFGIRDTVSPFSFVSYVASAGYSHVTNGQPNYGTNSQAFAQRFGATVLRDATENILAESILAGTFHEDPRYYVMGDGHNFFKRVLYSVTRPIITRTDGGNQTVNAAVIVGYAAGSATTYAYYPAINQNFKDTAATFGGSLAGAAVGDFVAEFWDDVFGVFHHKK